MGLILVGKRETMENIDYIIWSLIVVVLCGWMYNAIPIVRYILAENAQDRTRREKEKQLQ